MDEYEFERDGYRHKVTRTSDDAAKVEWFGQNVCYREPRWHVDDDLSESSLAVEALDLAEQIAFLKAEAAEATNQLLDNEAERRRLAEENRRLRKLIDTLGVAKETLQAYGLLDTQKEG